jgi:uncharacterized protein YjiS (DUF1127 family)
MIDTDFERRETGIALSRFWQRNFVASMLASIRDALAVRRDRRVLQELPDFILKDIGISRGNIDYMTVRGLADWRAQGRRCPARADCPSQCKASKQRVRQSPEP